MFQARDRLGSRTAGRAGTLLRELRQCADAGGGLAVPARRAAERRTLLLIAASRRAYERALVLAPCWRSGRWSKTGTRAVTMPGRLRSAAACIRSR